MFARTLVVLLFIAISSAGTADENIDLSQESVFTRENADTRLGQIENALSSFRELTDLVRASSNLKKDYNMPLIDYRRIPANARILSQFSGESLLKIENLDWESQNLGFANWPKSVRAHMDYQAYEIAKLKLEIAVLKKAPADQIKALKKDVQQREKDLRTQYLSDEAWAD